MTEFYRLRGQYEVGLSQLFDPGEQFCTHLINIGLFFYPI